MENNTINAANNPGLANKLIQDAMVEETVPQEPAKIKSPSEVVVHLPGGYISPNGEVYRTAEVRELNGRDEEAIVKANTWAKAMLTVLNRATVKVGEVAASEQVLDNILAADRDAIMLGIYRATFGDEIELGAACSGCNDVKTVAVDLTEDVKIKVLVDPLEDRIFKVSGKNTEYTVKLPEGKVQRELAGSSDKTTSEMDTILLEYCVMEINGKPVLGKSQVQLIGLSDRRKILEAILDKNPGPQFDDITTTCPDCGGEVVVPINIGALFRL